MSTVLCRIEGNACKWFFENYLFLVMVTKKVYGDCAMLINKRRQYSNSETQFSIKLRGLYRALFVRSPKVAKLFKRGTKTCQPHVMLEKKNGFSA